jgi:glycerol-3-phosphate dehydrogenase (NAD(P)+)
MAKDDSAYDRIAVIGAGAWGTALANVAARAGRAVTLRARDAATAAGIADSRESPRLPGLRLDDRVAVTADRAAEAEADAILLAVPAQALREVVTELAPSLTVPIISCAKGIERGSGCFMTEVITACAPAAVPAVLSGPSFAADVMRGLPTAVTLAAVDVDVAAGLARMLGSASFRPYHTTDVCGVEIGGAAKNVLAIAAGIVAGRGLGASASAALVTRGFAELMRLGRACGARPETLVGLSGLGDLVLTCSSPQSRNFALGVALAEGQPPARAQSRLAEGVFTASALLAMAQKHGVEMPIAAAVDAVLEERLSIDAAIESLLTRPFRAE